MKSLLREYEVTLSCVKYHCVLSTHTISAESLLVAMIDAVQLKQPGVSYVASVKAL